MKKMLLNLQLFAEGGAAGTAGTAGADAGGTGEAGTGVANPNEGQKSARVLYGKQAEQSIGHSETNTGNKMVTASTSEERKAAFNDLIRGDYKDAFDERVQQIVKTRIGETKSMQAELDSTRKLIYAMAERYGVDAKDIGKLTEAFNNDRAFYEEEAANQGISVEQLMEIKQLRASNKAFQEAYDAQQQRARGEETYNRWMQEAQNLQQRYGIEGFDFSQELTNPEFGKLLQSGVSVEAAYKAIHFDDMLGGAMAATARNVSSQVAKNIAGRHKRPTESAVSSQSGVVVKSDVSKLTKADRAEIIRRVQHGERIVF